VHDGFVFISWFYRRARQEPRKTRKGRTLFDLGDLQDELETLLGIHVDLLTPADLPPQFRAKVLAEAKPV